MKPVRNDLRLAAHCRSIRRSQATGLSVLVLIVAVLTVVACEAPPSNEDLPRIDEMESTMRPPGPPEVLANAPSVSRTRAVVQRLEIPLRYPTDPIWAGLNAGVIPEITRAVWNANGMRVGLLAEGQWSAFLDTLPVTFGVQRSSLSTASLPVAIRTSPRISESVYVDLTIPPRAVEDDIARGGRIKLLAKLQVVNTPGGSTRYIELTPHHYLPGINLPRAVRDGDSFKVTPRTPEERALDGRTYDDLTLRVELPPGQLLVVGLYWPWSDPVVADYVRQTADSVNDGLSPPSSDRVESVVEPTITSVEDLPEYVPPPPIGHHLGRALFTGARQGQPLQMLLVIGVD